MCEASHDGSANFDELSGLERFRAAHVLKNHWSRPIGSRSYYWYLTFGNSPALHSLARKCQEAIAFPYYDPVSLSELHLSLDRIAFEGDLTQDQLSAIQAAAVRACREISPFDITIGALGGTPGAIGFTASPEQPIRELRDAFRASTLSVCPDAPVNRSQIHPHVTIAYANSDRVPAGEAVAMVERLNELRPVNVAICEGAMVLLERRERSYAWQVVSRIPLAGSS